jgi:Protein of unknown function (DUF3223)
MTTEPEAPRISAIEYDLFKRCKEIKDRYPDGVPLSKDDRITVLTALRRHPDGRKKFGNGIDAVIVDKFIMSSRCFFVIRHDGTAEDFSLYNCFYPRRTKTARVESAMQRFNYGELIHRFQVLITTRRVAKRYANSQGR